MTKEQDQALAEIIRQASKNAEAINAKTKQIIANTNAAIKGVSEVKVDQTHLDNISASVQVAEATNAQVKATIEAVNHALGK